MDELRGQVFQRQDVIELELADTKQRLVDLEEATLKHVTNVNTVVETEMRRFDNVVSALEKQQLSLGEDLKSQVTTFKQENTKWRVDYEDITAKKITEIHQALKIINSQVKQTKDDIREVRDAFGTELKLVEQNMITKLNDTNHKIDLQEQTMEERIQVLVHRQKQKLEDVTSAQIKEISIK